MVGKILLYLFTIIFINVILFLLLSIFDAVFNITVVNLSYFLKYLIGTFIIFAILFTVKLYHVSAKRRIPEFIDLSNKKVIVGMTAFNDEESIGPTVREFINHPRVSKVVVIDNNSFDNTARNAREAGALLIVEHVQGYGSACIRALREISILGDILVLVEGDKTFRAKDLDKMLPYLENVDMVQGTRTTRELSSPDSQLNFLMNLGNQFVAKLLQIRFLGHRFTDVGCTYRIIRKDALLKIQENITVKRDHFLCQLMVEALKHKLTIVEVPITFWKRVGKSKGVGGRYIKGLYVAFRMCLLIYFH